MNTADYLLERGQDENVALIAEDGRPYTYRALRQAGAVVRDELLRADVCAGDAVGVLGTNSLFWVAAYLATLKLGAIAVPFPTVATGADLQRSQSVAGCKVICLEQRFAAKADAFEPDLPLLFDDCLQRDPTAGWPPADAVFDERQDAALMLTSGTTARPRAVRITHRNIQANTDSIISYLNLTAGERIMAVLPFYYCFGTSLLHTHLRVGGSLVLAHSFVYPELILNQMEETHCTGFAGVPSTYQTLLRNSTFARRRLPGLHKVQQAGGKLAAVLIHELVEALPQAEVFVMYGQTEATARLSYLPPVYLQTKLGSVGCGIPGVELRVLNEAGEDVKPGEVGEIYARGDNISPGYLNDPAETARKFVNGVLRTDDLATVDEDGFIYIVDRNSDFIKSYGYRVSSQEIEARVLEMPEVVAAAAVGVPDLVRGEAIRVFVVLRAGAALTVEDILAHCRQKLAGHMVPQSVVMLDSLPMNSQGKVLKAELRKLAQASASQAASA